MTQDANSDELQALSYGTDQESEKGHLIFLCSLQPQPAWNTIWKTPDAACENEIFF